MPAIAPTLMPTMVPLFILRLRFIDVGVGSPESVDVEAEGLLKTDVSVDTREIESLSQASPIANKFLVVVGLLFHRVNCAVS